MYFKHFSKRRRNEKPGKGLRHFAMRVCEKVRSKMVTTYNEVADELVAEYPEGSNAEQVSLKINKLDNVALVILYLNCHNYF